MPGATVCKWHGAGAPQVKAAALERLRQMVPEALEKYETLLHDGPPKESVTLMKDLLDRVDITEAKSRTEIEVRSEKESLVLSMLADIAKNQKEKAEPEQDDGTEPS